MHVTISNQDVIDYIFSSDTSRKFVSYREASDFKQAFTDSILNNPYCDTLYFEREISNERYNGVLVRGNDGYCLFGSIKENVGKSIEAKYKDENIRNAVRYALRDALKAVYPEIAEHTHPRCEKYTITNVSYNDIYDRYITIAEDNFCNRIQWWQDNEPSYNVGDTFSIKFN